jgi:hypothetical protein
MVICILTALAGIAIACAMMIRKNRLSPLSRNSLAATAFGLFTVSNLARFEYDFGGILFECGVAFLMIVVAYSHLKTAVSEARPREAA